jgi:competence protein ComEC
MNGPTNAKLEAPTPEVCVHILDVGQGDAIVIVFPKTGRALIVDAYDGDRVLELLERESVRELVAFLTHSDNDHVAGLDRVLRNFQGKLLAVFWNLDKLGKGRYHRQYLELTARATRDHQAWSGEFSTNLNYDWRLPTLSPNSVALEVLHPSHDDISALAGSSTNDASGVLRLVCSLGDGQQQTVLLAGDLEITGMSRIFERCADKLHADVLKYPHHGAWPTRQRASRKLPHLPLRTTEEFLSRVDPRVVVISVGRANSKGHVSPRLFEALARLSAGSGRLHRVLCTQITETCLASPVGGQGVHCAHDIELRMGRQIEGGLEVLPPPAQHELRIEKVTSWASAGCREIRGH